MNSYERCLPQANRDENQFREVEQLREKARKLILSAQEAQKREEWNHISDMYHNATELYGQAVALMKNDTWNLADLLEDD